MKPGLGSAAGNTACMVLKWFVNAQGWAELISVKADNHWFTASLFIPLTQLSVDLIILEFVQESPSPLTGLQTPCRSPEIN